MAELDLVQLTKYCLHTTATSRILPMTQGPELGEEVEMLERTVVVREG